MIGIIWVGRTRGRRAPWLGLGFCLACVLVVVSVSGCGSSGSVGSTNATVAPSPSTRTARPTVAVSPWLGSQTPAATDTVSPTVSPSAHGQFAVTGSMAVARSGPTAVLLKDGRVLVVGGSGDDTAELYDPQTGAFGQTGPMDDIRISGVTADLLPDGRVLIAGGCDNSLDQKPIASVELYDPTTGKFAPTGSMAQARSEHTATLLPDGRVLIAGGFGGSGDGLASAELYDLKTGKFTPTGSMAHARSYHTATLLPDGRVLMVGGSGTGAYNDPTPTSAEVYDPKTGKFTPTGSMATRRWSGHTATLLKDGRVLVVGGNSSAVEEKPLASAELYDPKTGRFSSTGPMGQARDGQSAVLLPDGLVLVVGGDGDSAELYDPQAGAFGVTGSTVSASGGQTATLLRDGRVLILGGWDGISLQQGSNTAELYQP